MEMRAHAPRRVPTAIVEKTERPPRRAFLEPVQLSLESRLASLQEVQVVLSRMLAAAGADADEAVNIGVAVRECVVNAIRHGNREDAGKTVRLSLAVRDDVLEVLVADQGPGFDPSTLPDPFAPENLLRPDGRGMVMMRSFMDDVSFTFPAGGGTVVRMRKRL